MKYTPAPWHIEQDVVRNGDIHIFADELLGIADVDVRESPDDTGSVPREVALTNARLMAAAPELYDACQAALLTLNINRRYVTCEKLESKLRAAIAKARGEQ